MFYIGKSNQEDTANRERIEKQLHTLWSKLDNMDSRLDEVKSELYKLNVLYNTQRKD